MKSAFRSFVACVIAAIVFGTSLASADTNVTDPGDWGNTQVAAGLEMRHPLGGAWTGTANVLRFATPQSAGEINFVWFGVENQLTPTLWISPQVGAVMGWADYECTIAAFWTGWDFRPNWELTTDTEVILGGGLSDYFGHFELNRKVSFGKVGLHFEQVDDRQQMGPHVQFKRGGIKLNLGVYAGSGSSNARIGVAYTADL